MPIAKSNSGPQQDPVPAGTALGICYAVIDIGTPPPSGNFPSRRKVQLLFELPHIRGEYTDRVTGITADRARVISVDYTLSTDKKANLRKQLAAWRGRDFTEDEAKAFNVSKVVGAVALLSIVHKKSADGQKTFANITSIMKPMAGTEKPAQENPLLIFDIPESGPIEIPAAIPEWIANRIKASDEYVDRLHPQSAKRGDVPSNGQAFPTNGNDDPDSVPF